MRTRGRISWWIGLSLAGLVALGGTAQAGPRALHDDDGRTPWPPPPNTLPVGPHPVPAQLIDAALALPAAREAISLMEANGYTRTPDDDIAQSRDGRAFVTLAFTDPANPEHAPLVLVASDPGGATPRTWVAGGVFRLDPATSQVSLADDVPESNQFIVPVPYPGGTASAQSGARSLRDWMGCSFAGCGVAFVGCVRLGGLLLITPQAKAGCAIAGCAILSFICLW